MYLCVNLHTYDRWVFLNYKELCLWIVIIYLADILNDASQDKVRGLVKQNIFETVEGVEQNIYDRLGIMIEGVHQSFV